MKLRTIAETSELIRRRQVSPVEVVRECLGVIDRLNPTLNAFITVTAESALREARDAEAEIQSGSWRGPLHGIPIGLKDIVDTAGIRTTAASAQFRDRVPAEDAEVVKKLKAAGAVLIGKQNLHEFAYGGSSLISHFGPVRNPANIECIAGGSSGGSAAAVASGMCYAAIGTDTAGSIREPAALCGIVGFKPTYELVSTRGIIPLSPSLDHAGPIARSVEDTAIVLEVLTGTREGYRRSLDQKDGSVLGIPREHFFEDLDSEVAAHVDRAISKFSEMGFAVREFELNVDSDRTLQRAESYEYHREMIAASLELYDPETLRRLRTGEEISAAEYEEAKAALQRERQDITKQLQGIDIFITPTTPVPASRISDLIEDIERLRPAEITLLRNTRPMNVWGLPAISIPCGSTSAGLPIGMQIAAAPNDDRKVLRAAYKYEQATR